MIFDWWPQHLLPSAVVGSLYDDGWTALIYENIRISLVIITMIFFASLVLPRSLDYAVPGSRAWVSSGVVGVKHIKHGLSTHTSSALPLSQHMFQAEQIVYGEFCDYVGVHVYLFVA